MTGCVILFPIAMTFYITWWFIHFVDGFFSPLYAHLGIDIFGLGFVTSITFIFLLGVFMSSWLSPDQESKAFKDVAIIRHPRVGEYALGFITSTVILKRDTGAEELCCVYVPTNHLYVGDMYLINSRDIIRPKLYVREGIEIVVSGGLSIPQVLTISEARTMHVDILRASQKLKCASP